MNNVKPIRPQALQQAIEQRRAMPDNQGQMPPGGGNGEPPLEARVIKLESIAEKTSERLGAIEKDVAVIKSNYATKADVAEAKNSIIMWVVSAILLAQLLPPLLKKFGL